MRHKLNSMYTELPSGAPLTSDALKALGISADLAVHYVRSGSADSLSAWSVLPQRRHSSLRPSSTARATDRRTARRRPVALAWYGITHYVSQHTTLHLYGWAAARLPGWFIERFPAEYHRKRLFDERPPKMINVTPFEKLVDAPLVSAPERAFLELLSEVGVRQPLQEARELAESMYALRTDVLEDLLKRCSSVKRCGFACDSAASSRSRGPRS